MEDGEKKNELVKLRLCPDCSYKLNYKTQKRQAKSQKVGKKDKRNQSDVVTEDHAETRSKRRKYSSGGHEDGSVEGNHYSSLDIWKMNGTNVVSYLEETARQTKDKSEEAASVWKTQIKVDEEKTTNEQLDSYFADLLQWHYFVMYIL